MDPVTNERSKPKSNESSSSKNAYREISKRLRGIFNDEGMAFGPDPTDANTLVERFKVVTNLRKSQIEEVLCKLRRARNVQLCFLVDCTGSMQPHINGVRQSIFEIVKKLTEGGKGEAVAQSLKVAFVAYRDHNDGAKQFEVLPFTDVEQFKTFCSGLRAHGGPSGVGMDATEDVFGGLDTALNLSWSADCGTKVIFHICDYPCHGREFHNIEEYDGYPDGDPKGRTCEELFSRVQEKGIQYHFGKITSYTDIMIQKFSVAYGDAIMEFDVKNALDIKDSVIEAVSQSVSASVSTSMMNAGSVRVERPFTLDKTEPDWESIRETKGRFVSYEFPQSIKDIEDDVPLESRRPKSAIVKIAENPFGKGAERLAFYGKDVSTYVAQPPPKGGQKTSSSRSKESSKTSQTSLEILKKNEDMVLKEYLHIGKDQNTAKRYELSNQMQTIASYLAQEFTKDMKKRDRAFTQTLKFIKIKTLSVMEGTTIRFMSCEKRLSAGDKFVRFTNNTDYHINIAKTLALGVSMDFVQLVTAFSHWTYKATNRFLMVVDLEGVVPESIGTGTKGVLLTDPAIHCKDVTRYGRMNLGEDGMKKFFERHTCNEFCQKLGLESFVC